MTKEEFNSLPTIASFLPLKFPGGGNQEWTSVKVGCADCKKQVPSLQTRGHADLQVHDGAGCYRSKTAYAWHITAFALCPLCDKMTTALVELHENMTMVSVNSVTGERTKWVSRKASLWRRSLDKINRVFSRAQD